jgi:hypothetical protein
MSDVLSYLFDFGKVSLHIALIIAFLIYCTGAIQYGLTTQQSPDAKYDLSLTGSFTLLIFLWYFWCFVVGCCFGWFTLFYEIVKCLMFFTCVCLHGWGHYKRRHGWPLK